MDIIYKQLISTANSAKEYVRTEVKRLGVKKTSDIPEGEFKALVFDVEKLDTIWGALDR